MLFGVVGVDVESGSLSSGCVNDVTLKFVGSPVLETEVWACLVVEPDILRQVSAEVFEGLDGPVPEVLVLDGSVCPFHESVVVAGVAHADPNACVLEFLGVFDAPVLRSFVGMVDEFLVVLGGVACGEGHVEGSYVGLCEHAPRSVVPDDLSRVQVFDQHDVTEHPADGEVKDVAGPDLVDIEKDCAAQKVGSSVMGFRVSGFVEFSLQKRLVAVRHAISEEGVSAREVRAEFVVDLLEGHGGVILALLRQGGRKEGKAVLLTLAAPHRQPVGLLGGAGHLVQGAHGAGALSGVMAEPFEAGPPKVFF